jgi:hypothetical protein
MQNKNETHHMIISGAGAHRNLFIFQRQANPRLPNTDLTILRHKINKKIFDQC